LTINWLVVEVADFTAVLIEILLGPLFVINGHVGRVKVIQLLIVLESSVKLLVADEIPAQVLLQLCY